MRQLCMCVSEIKPEILSKSHVLLPSWVRHLRHRGRKNAAAHVQCEKIILQGAGNSATS